MLKVGKAIKPIHLWCIGDLADFYTVSAHSKDPARKQFLIDEVADVNKGLDELDELGAEDKVFVEGNHCDRLRRYLEEKAPELFGLMSTPGLFRLKERGWHFVPYKRDVKRGKLHLTHDVGNCGRYATFRALDTYQHSVVTGHTHRLCYVVEGNATGEQKLSAQFGWLGDVNTIGYMHRVKALKDWALGFGIGHLDPKTGFTYLQPIPIVEYSCVVNGKLYSA
jgi:hypothetical protein